MFVPYIQDCKQNKPLSPYKEVFEHYFLHL